jgi:hypothetical protein
MMGNPKARRYMERWGLVNAVHSAIAWRLRQSLGLHVYGIYTRPLHMPAAEPPAEKQGYTHRLFEPADADVLLGCIGNPELQLDEAFVRTAFAKGDACSAVFHGTRLVSYHWMAFSPTHDCAGVYVDFGPKHRYAYNAFTLAEFRGHHATRLFNLRSDAYCLRRGRLSTIAFIATDNQASIRSALGIGYRRIGFAGFLKLGPLFLPFRSAGVKSEGFRLFVPSAPRAAA